MRWDLSRSRVRLGRWSRSAEVRIGLVPDVLTPIALARILSWPLVQEPSHESRDAIHASMVGVMFSAQRVPNLNSENCRMSLRRNRQRDTKPKTAEMVVRIHTNRQWAGPMP